MNRRTAKWLAEQIGEVVEIPSDSRECWEKFMRVRIRIDISKPLKRWLRLKLEKSEGITMVTLKYERLPEFCFACGRIGHGIMECLDTEARKAAIEGNPTKFGAWMKAPIPEKSNSRSNSQGNGSSPERLSMAAMSGKWGVALIPLEEVGPSNVVDIPATLAIVLTNQTSNQEQTSEITNPLPSPTKKTTRKWKRHAREGKHLQKSGFVSSPFHRLLEKSKSPVKAPIGKGGSPPKVKKIIQDRNGNSPQRKQSPLPKTPS
ncbi:hypothetical protein EZV62_014754 [Acer yangbiense]|uniref:CCHC-type domain-containing protein n=1 Tax=Acer yangbiense TaxID=1000413 RepID=A0A5C7HT10_9ROSI|nr:hypothetical protein EZV62_014754 [Acer yangbiense]